MLGQVQTGTQEILLRFGGGLFAADTDRGGLANSITIYMAITADYIGFWCSTWREYDRSSR